MARKNRTPEENFRREKNRELLQMANIGSLDDIQSLFKEAIVFAKSFIFIALTSVLQKISPVIVLLCAEQ